MPISRIRSNMTMRKVLEMPTMMITAMTITTVMVMLMASVFATFFFLVDLIIRISLETILRLAS